jgi:hypothetical protein
MDNGNYWCPVATDLGWKLGDMQLEYGEDWPESAEREYAALEVALREHIKNCAPCQIADATVQIADAELQGPTYYC